MLFAISIPSSHETGHRSVNAYCASNFLLYRVMRSDELPVKMQSSTRTTRMRMCSSVRYVEDTQVRLSNAETEVSERTAECVVPFSPCLLEPI